VLFHGDVSNTVTLPSKIVIEFVDFVHSPEFKITRNTVFLKLDLFTSSGEGKEKQTLCWVF
jgi:hypothetical protein